jgi:RHS repeat-associated protein
VLANGNIRDSIFDSDKHLLSETAQFTGGATPGQPYDYVWFGDRPVAQVDPTGTHWTYSDHLGTPLIQTDTNGTVTWQAEYEPYGSTYALRAGDVHQPLRLPGQSAEQFDTGANGFSPLSYNNARWYQPAWGQNTQPDPLGFAGSPTNLYAYANNDPLNLIDPSGEEITPITFAIAAGEEVVGLGPEDPFADAAVAATFAEAAATVATTEDTAASAALAFNTPLMVGALGGAAAAAPALEEELQGVGSQAGDTCSIAEHLAEEAEGRFSTYDTSITLPGSRFLNVGTDVRPQEFQSNLLSNGYNIVKQAISTNGPVTVLSNGSQTYAIYTRTTTGLSGAQLDSPGISIKFSLGTP